MPKYVINKMEDMAIKEYNDVDIIFTERNRIDLEFCTNYVNIHYTTTGLDNNYNSYNIN